MNEGETLSGLERAVRERLARPVSVHIDGELSRGTADRWLSDYCSYCAETEARVIWVAAHRYYKLRVCEAAEDVIRLLLGTE